MTAPPGTDLTCRELVELVTDYVHGALPEGERLRFELHLAGCRGCRAYLRQMEATIRAAGRLSEAALSGEAREALLRAFRAWKAGAA